ncbi:MAG: hypothetical protein N2663_08320 [Chlorobi bacterium]|nr:hypothetical protein [Chlorobiota bacterium]
MRVAMLDIGTNTLLMLVADITNAELRMVADEHRIARLGEGLDQTGIISDAALERASQIVSEYRMMAEMFCVQQRGAVGTSALRRASNASVVAEKLAEIWGAPIEIISGDLEAELIYNGTVPFGHRAAVLDIGGGSTELVVGNGDRVEFRVSLEIGALRIAERFWNTYPIPAANLKLASQFVREQITESLPALDVGQLFGVAGTPTTLACIAAGLDRFDPSAIEGYKIRKSVIEELCEELTRCSVDQLRSIPAVHPQRANILPAGCLILAVFLDVLNHDVVIVSTRGLRFGAAYRLYRQVLDLQRN